MKATQNHILTIFGASGDLAYRKLIPSLYDLFDQNLLQDCFGMLGVSRTAYSDEAYREKVVTGI